MVDHIVKPDLVAPGNAQVSLRVAGSTLDTLYPQYEVTSTNGTSKYFVLSGTSMATPMVSGAVALMLQQNSIVDSRSSESALDEDSLEEFRAIYIFARQPRKPLQQRIRPLHLRSGLSGYQTPLLATRTWRREWLFPRPRSSTPTASVTVANTIPRLGVRRQQRGLGCNFGGLGKLSGMGCKRDFRQLGSVGRNQRGLGSDLRFWLQCGLGRHFYGRKRSGSTRAMATLGTTKQRTETIFGDYHDKHTTN